MNIARIEKLWSEAGHEPIEFARRLTAEQQKGESVAWEACDCDPKSDVCKLGRIRSLSTAEFARCAFPTYATPPQDAQDAKRYRWLRAVSTFRGDVLPINFWDKLGDEVDDEFDARIDAAMKEPTK